MNINKQFVKDRKKAFEAAVLRDDWKAVKHFCKKYQLYAWWVKEMKRAENEAVLKASVYKACQYCTDLSEEVKNEAFYKCLKLGFSPLIYPIYPESESDTE